MTATKNQPHAHYQDIHTAIPLTPTRCHPTAQSQAVKAGEVGLFWCAGHGNPLNLDQLGVVIVLLGSPWAAAQAAARSVLWVGSSAFVADCPSSDR